MFTFTHKFEFALQLVKKHEEPCSGTLPLGWLLDRFRFYHTEQAKLGKALLAAAIEQQQCRELKVRIEKERASSEEFLGVVECEWFMDIQQTNQQLQSLVSEIEMVRQTATMEREKHEMQKAHTEEELTGLEEALGNFASDQCEKLQKAEQQRQMLASELEEARKDSARERSKQECLKNELVIARDLIAQKFQQRMTLASELEKTCEAAAKQQQQCEVLQTKLEKVRSNLDPFMELIRNEWVGDLAKAEAEWKKMEHKYLVQIEQLTTPPSSPRFINGDAFKDNQCSNSDVAEIMV
ncbi:hypothetical protein H4R24_001689 [Coemansia sp. RSA 988]|nr:hypothetical protein H4R24_001689 [Coemansia sp. RSA 988]